MKLCYTFIKQYHNPGVAFLSSAVAVLCRYSMYVHSVISCGHCEYVHIKVCKKIFCIAVTTHCQVFYRKKEKCCC